MSLRGRFRSFRKSFHKPVSLEQSRRSFSSDQFYHQQTQEENHAKSVLSNKSLLVNCRKTIVLCHGCFGLSSQFMHIERALLSQGYRVLNYAYSSTRQSLDRSAEGLKNFLDEANRRDSKLLGTDDGSIVSPVGHWIRRMLQKEINLKKRNVQEVASVDEVLQEAKPEYHFVTHSMGSMIVRRFLVRYILEVDKQQSESEIDIVESEVDPNSVESVLRHQNTIKLIQVSPVLSGKVELAKQLRFLKPVAKLLRRHNAEPTIVEQLMEEGENKEEEEKIHNETMWWPVGSNLQNKVKMYDIVTSVRKMNADSEGRLHTDIVLSVKEQTSRRPSHLESRVEYIVGDHASTLHRPAVIKLILDELARE